MVLAEMPPYKKPEKRTISRPAENQAVNDDELVKNQKTTLFRNSHQVITRCYEGGCGKF
jgi:hypothetical protein